MLIVGLKPLICLTASLPFLIDFFTDRIVYTRKNNRYSIYKIVKEVFSTAVVMQNAGNERGIASLIECTV